MKTTLICLVVYVLLFNISLDAQSLDGQVFIIENVSNQKVLDADSVTTIGVDGSIVHLWKNNGQVNQHWKFIVSGDGDQMYYIVNQDPKTGKSNYLEVSSLDVGRNGGKVHLWNPNGGSSSPYGANQVWAVIRNEDGSYSIASAHVKSNGAYALELAGGDEDKNRGKVQTGWNKGYENQKWKLIPVN